MPPQNLLSISTRPSLAAAVRTYASVVPHGREATAPTQPPSYRAAEARKTQLQRTYLSIIRSAPLMLVFQHNNLRSVEWSALRREVALALAKVVPAGDDDAVASGTRLHVVRGALFSQAMRVAERYDARGGQQHGTSREANDGAKKKKHKHRMAALLSGHIGLVTFPAVSPPHIRAVANIMFPDGRTAKGLDPLAVAGLQKLVLLAARVDGHVASGSLAGGRLIDASTVRWAGELPGFVPLRGQLAGMLQNASGADLVRALEALPVSTLRTLDAHRKVLAGELES